MKYMKEASDIVKKAKKEAKSYKGEDANEKNRLDALAQVAAQFKSACQQNIASELADIREMLKYAKAVVTKALKSAPKNEGVEYSDELITAMIESFNYEYDDAFENMSEANEPEIDEDDISDEDEE